MAAFVIGVRPGDATPFESEFAEGRARFSEGEERRADVVGEARQRQVFGSERPARAPRVRLEYDDAMPLGRHHASGDQTIRPGPDHHDVSIPAHLRVLAYCAFGFSFPSNPRAELVPEHVALISKRSADYWC